MKTMAIAGAALLAAASAPASVEVTIPGPRGALAGTLVDINAAQLEQAKVGIGRPL